MMRVLLTGMSGTGKSALSQRLRELGYTAVDLDSDEWSHWVDFDGDPTGARAGKDWVWREDAVQDLLENEVTDLMFVSGCTANMGRFLPQFDHVVLLSAPLAVLLKRLASRRGNPYGKHPEEAAAILRNIAEVEPLLRNVAGHEIDTTVPLQEVVKRVLDAVRSSANENKLPSAGRANERLRGFVSEAER
jgi:broad-specificity NMP kinase